MLLNEPDKDWEKIGRKDPYFGVLRHPQYRTRSLTPEAREQFFQSGEARIRTVIDTIDRHLGVAFKPQRALDFGCGVGRLLIPLARRSGEVTGIDISASMLAEARRNCETQGVGNVRVARDLSALEGSYDFIHSHIVFQHMKVARGEAVFAQLLERLTPGGIGVVHFTYAKRRLGQTLRGIVVSRVPLGAYLFNLFKGMRPWAPHLQMNNYRLDRLFSMLQRARIADLHVEFTDHGGYLGAVLYFRKP